MSRKRQVGTFPEPPWTYAPSEVAAWMASTAGPRRTRGSRPRRQVRVKGFIGRCPTSAEGKLFHRLGGLGFQRAKGAKRFHAILAGPTDSNGPAEFEGKLGAARVHIRIRKGAALELRMTFDPRVSFRHASKFLSRLGLRGLEGSWK